MSRRYWGLVVAVGLILTAGAASDQQSANQQRENTAHSRSQAPATLPPEEQTADSGKAYSPACNDPKSREDASFCVERRAALAAEKTNILADKIFWPTVGGIFVGAVGAIFAGLAAGAAGRAAIAAEKSLAHADDVMRNELRAYVHVEKAEISWGSKAGSKPSVTLSVRNTGQTPAKWYGIRSKTFVGEPVDYNREGFDSFSVRECAEKKWSALSGGGGILTCQGIADEDERQSVSAAYKPAQVVSIVGVVTYETIFDEVFETEFWFVRRPPHRYEAVFLPSEQVGKAPLPPNRFRETPSTMGRAAFALSTYQKVGDEA